jgi:hypothetical protein
MRASKRREQAQEKEGGRTKHHSKNEQHSISPKRVWLKAIN